MGGACNSYLTTPISKDEELSDMSLCESILQDLKSNNNVKQRASSLLKHLSTHRLYRRTRKSTAKRKVLGEQKFQRGSIYFNTCVKI